MLHDWKMTDDTRSMALFQYNLVSRYQNVSIPDFTGAKDDESGGLRRQLEL